MYFKAKQTDRFNIRRLEVLDQTITGKLLRNNLARAIAFEEILNFDNHDEHELFLQYYATINTSPSYLAEVLALHKDISKMDYGKSLPKIQLQNSSRVTVSSASIPDGRTSVIYFWSQTQMNHFKRTHERVVRYKKQFPAYRFVGICIQPYNDLVRNYQEIMQIDPQNQLALVNFERVSNEWVITLLNKGIIIDQNGNILNGFANFSASDFTDLLEKHQP